MRKSLPTLLLLAVAFALGGAVVHLAEAPLTSSVVGEAAKIMGLEFTPAEADSMLDELRDTRKNFEANRKIDLPNDIAPALVFDPLPPNFQFEKTRLPFKASNVGAVKLPARRDDLAFYSVRELAELIRTKQISSVELTKFFLARLKRYDPQLHCVVTLTEDLALQQAAHADADLKAGRYHGLLHGIPYGAKDLLAKKGYPTTWGSVPFKTQTLDYDATVVQRLEKAGAVLCAKLSLGELAWGDVWFGGTTKNPWDLSRGSSGSSAGSASAVAAGCLPFAIGSETLGSIVSPATECGATGLRPTFGRVPRTGAMALSWSMDKLGPLCRTVEDCAIVFNAILGPDGQDASALDAPFNYNGAAAPLKNLKFGYLRADFARNYPNRGTDSSSLAVLRKLGMELVPIDLPDLPANDISFVLGVEAAAAFDELTRSGKDDQMVRQIKNAWPNAFRAARFVPAVEYVQAARHRTRLIRAMAAILRGLDGYVTPSFGRSLTLTNLTGHPCVVLPNGFRREPGKPERPLSITFTGQLFSEAKLLQVAKAYQDATGFHKKHPKLE